MPPDHPVRTARGLSVVLGVLLALLVALPAPPAAAEEPRPGLLRIAHLSPDTPRVDVAVTPAAAPGQVLTDPGPVVAPALGYGAVGGYRELPPGGYAVSVRAAGGTGAPVLSARVDVAPGQARTVVVGGAFADLALSTVDDDLGAPPAGAARVRVLAATGSGPVDVAVVGGPVLASGLAPGAAATPVDVPAGRYRVAATGARDEPALELQAGSVVTALVLDGADGTVLRTVLDAAGPSVRPVGGVEAGGRSRTPARGLRGIVAALTAAAARAEAQPAAPVRLRLPSLGVDAGLAGAGLDATGALVPPADPATVGWFTGGPRPGETGPAVVTGHVDWAGRPGTLHRLGAVVVGEEVLVDRADGSTVGFRVTAVDRYAKAAFPTEKVYSPTAGAELRLVTCGGPFDPVVGSYRDNVVVTAVRVG
ncbi:class F sortase [Blastococcus sp. TF02A-35]|uniref:class F sortase n=1 Tax=Blastococcus sp. TF02A-35 TaxID=2559612 RepID=UPI0010743A92|nr:class F sortase [Blastococcus sp. TF02A_35]TFV50491.1 class F sortase [Blastococcus sp. TF02A_35]